MSGTEEKKTRTPKQIVIMDNQKPQGVKMKKTTKPKTYTQKQYEKLLTKIEWLEHDKQTSEAHRQGLHETVLQREKYCYELYEEKKKLESALIATVLKFTEKENHNGVTIQRPNKESK